MASIAAVFCFFVGIALTGYVGLLVRGELVYHHKSDVIAELSDIRAKLELEISRAVAHGLGLRDFLGEFQGDPFEPDDFRNIATELLETNSSIRSIGIAPGNVLQAVYPLASNESAIGLDYRSNAAQWPAVEQAMRSREIVISGPVDLVQGGRALLIRIPVYPAGFTSQPLAERSYWGVATLVMDEDKLLSFAGILPVQDDLRVSVVSRADGGSTETLLYGSEIPEESDPVAVPLVLPGAVAWELLAYPEGGWQSAGKQVWITQFVGSVLALVFSVMTFLLISEIYRARSIALHDPLTGLANRRLLEERMQQLAAMCERSGVGFEIFYLDLDAFKPVNDNYGHSVGDQLLIEIGQRLQNQTREYDTVARVGGDEFIVLTPGSMRQAEKETFTARLAERVNAVFEFSGTHIDIRASIGSASYPMDAATISDLLRIADGRMYAQKARSKQAAPNLPKGGVPQAG
ncbi:diguanylate cyclase [Roseibium sp. MMSF_3412]|uniref:diguanylate cyclase domain-containing protein n=1 Tax=Roseibium sp. MMSF_3412 TaxID=3046712 RepID=UPI00273E2F50|nr:diguanylate cyclase [Roseibium sp. MMSF_3412]